MRGGKDETASYNFIHSQRGSLETDFFKRTTIIRLGIPGESMDGALVRLLREENLNQPMK
jgi:hypothetical protein